MSIIAGSSYQNLTTFTTLTTFASCLYVDHLHARLT